MPTRTVNVGFLGAGFMGQLAHLHSFTRVEGCAVTALAEARPELGRKVAARYRVPTVYARHQQLLADEAVEAVVMSQPYHRNAVLGRQVLEAGKHLLTEKPMVARSDDARQLVELAASKGLIYAVGFMKRYDPGMELARSLIERFARTGELGKPVLVEAFCSMGDWLHNVGKPVATDEPAPTDDIAPCYPDFLPEALRGAYDHFLNIYSHNVNLVRFLLGDPEVEVLSAHRHDRSYLVNLAAGELLIGLRGAPGKSHRWEEHTAVQYEKGRIDITSASPMNRQAIAQVTVRREVDGVMTDLVMHPPVEWAFFRQARAFVEAVATGKEPVSAGSNCVADVELMEEVFEKLTS